MQAAIAKFINIFSFKLAHNSSVQRRYGKRISVVKRDGFCAENLGSIPRSEKISELSSLIDIENEHWYTSLCKSLDCWTS